MVSKNLDPSAPVPAEHESNGRDLLGDARLQELLAPAGRREVQRARQVFVNRNLRLAGIDLVGFDMDYTLAVYRKQSIEQLSFEMTLDRMIAKRGYPESIRALAYDHAFVMRGLALDRTSGNLLKMDRFRHVGRAYHGRALLASDEKRRVYRGEKIDLKSERFAWIDTLFALPEACLYAEVVETLEATGQRVDYDKLYVDIRECIDEVHRDDSLKSVIRTDLARFILPDPELGPTLHKLRSGGKKLFLLTNSGWDYTDLVMRFLLDGFLPEYPSWRHYFDLVVAFAGKPSFFSEARPFLELDPSTGKVLGEARSLERGKAYQGGNLADFERMAGIGGEKVLYVGDHIYGDILKSKKSSLWRTCMIIEELEDEIAYTDRCASDVTRLAALEALRARLDDEVNTRKLALNSLERRLERAGLDEENRRHVEEIRKKEKAELERLRRALKESGEEAEGLEARVEKGFNSYWGLMFKEGTENSRFGEQVEQYACIYTSRVSNLLAYSPMQYFRSPRDFMPHERVAPANGNGKGAPGMLAPLGSEGPPKGSASS
ncbi:MAG TPA: HAD-IG family 5'-nucleotidase [Myxococcales bacterium]|jgi:HAD superfamily 5'-nucleotidase-like hydrolase